MELQILKNNSDYGDKFLFHSEGAEMMVSEKRPCSQALSALAGIGFLQKRNFFLTGHR